MMFTKLLKIHTTHIEYKFCLLGITKQSYSTSPYRKTVLNKPRIQPVISHTSDSGALYLYDFYLWGPERTNNLMSYIAVLNK